MLDTLKGEQEGKTIAVLGSAPSVTLFQRREEFIIGINGAGSFLQEGDLFLSYDRSTGTKSWFQSLPANIRCMLRSHAAIYSPRFYPDEEQRKRYISFYEGYMEAHPEEVITSEKGLRYIPDGNVTIDNYFLNELPPPEKPNLLFRTVSADEVISRDQKRVRSGGSSACVAVQVAFVLGAREIHIYGVEFSNDESAPSNIDGTRYFYTPLPGETGRTLPRQRVTMDIVIKAIMEKGVNVYSHGPTRLENSIKVSD